MSPFVGPLSATMFGWLLAALLAGGWIIWSTHAEGMRPSQIALVLLGCTAALLVGAKILYLVEIFPDWDASAVVSARLVRLPGGILLLLLISPWLPRAPGGGAWRLADTIAPALALLILGTRIGCFLEGCCYGMPSSLPWALPFPRGSEVYGWQLQHGIIGHTATHSVPVQPLQLYFAIAGALMFLITTEVQARKRYEGQVALVFAVLFLWSTWLLELLRAQPHPSAREFTLLAAVIAAAVALRSRAKRFETAGVRR